MCESNVQDPFYLLDLFLETWGLNSTVKCVKATCKTTSTFQTFFFFFFLSLHSFPAAPLFCRHIRVFRIPSFRTKSNGQRSFSYRAPTAWNQFCPFCCFCHVFKLSLKPVLFRITTVLQSHRPEICSCVSIIVSE